MKIETTDTSVKLMEFRESDGNILKIAKVSALPSFPDANTLYVIIS